MKNSTNFVNPNTQGVNERAQAANRYAQQARLFRDKRNSLDYIVKEWEGIMDTSPVGWWTIIFFFLAVVEIFISWKMYSEMQSSITDVPKPYLTIIIGVALVLVGVGVSHFVGKRFSSNLFNLEVFNLRHHSNNTILYAVAEEKIQVKTTKHFRIGLGVFLIFMLLVITLSIKRVGLMGSVTGQNFGIEQNLLPIIFVILEVIFGIYVMYFFKCLTLRLRTKRQHRNFENSRAICAYETSMSKSCYDYALQRGEQPTNNREIRDTLFRYEHRSHDNDEYVDPIPETKYINVMVMDNGKPSSGVHLFGVLPSRELTNSTCTDDSGNAVIEWFGDDDFLVGLMFNNDLTYQGPLRKHIRIKIDIAKLSSFKAVA